MPDHESSPRLKIRLLSRPCPGCGITQFSPSRHRDKRSPRLARLSIFPYRCDKCGLLFYARGKSGQAAAADALEERRASERRQERREERREERRQQARRQSAEAAPVAKRSVATWGLSAALLAVAIALAFSLSQAARTAQARDEATRSYLRLAALDEVESALSDMEAANRGFLLTGDDGFRATFNHDRDTLSERYKVLLQDAAGDVVRQQKLQGFKTDLTQWFTLYNPSIQQRRAGEWSQEQKLRVSKCKALFDHMRATLAELRAAREATLRQ